MQLGELDPVAWAPPGQHGEHPGWKRDMREDVTHRENRGAG